MNHNSLFNHVQKAPCFWGDYLAYCTLHTTRPKTVYTQTLLHLSQQICRHRHASTDTDYTHDELKECLIKICKLPPRSWIFEHAIEKWLVSFSEDDVKIDLEEDEAGLQFKRQLLCAAAWLGERGLVEKLLQEGCNHHNYG